MLDRWSAHRFKAGQELLACVAVVAAFWLATGWIVQRQLRMHHRAERATA